MAGTSEEDTSSYKCPVVGLVINRLPEHYGYHQLVSYKDGGDIHHFEAPGYAKLLVGALAIAAREDYQCWTYGCPATVWENTGIPHRCSYWLCPQCSRATMRYYGSLQSEYN